MFAAVLQVCATRCIAEMAWQCVSLHTGYVCAACSDTQRRCSAGRN